MVKNLQCRRHWVRSLDWEDPLEKGMATHPTILAWKITWTEEPGRLQSMGSERVRHNYVTNTYTRAYSETAPWREKHLRPQEVNDPADAKIYPQSLDK